MVNFFKTTKKHFYHLVDASPWPFIVSLLMMTVAMLLALSLHYNNAWTCFEIILFNVNFDNIEIATVASNKEELLKFFSFKSIKIFLILFFMPFFYDIYQYFWYYFFFFILSPIIFWLKDVVIEATYLGYHTKQVKNLLKFGFLIFIVSEIMFFFSFFWAFFHSSLAPASQLGGIWPPLNIVTPYTWDLPFVNTILLIASGAWITAAHYMLIATGNKKENFDYFYFGLDFNNLKNFIQFFCTKDSYINSLKLLDKKYFKLFWSFIYYIVNLNISTFNFHSLLLNRYFFLKNNKKFISLNFKNLDDYETEEGFLELIVPIYPTFQLLPSIEQYLIKLEDLKQQKIFTRSFFILFYFDIVQKFAANTKLFIKYQFINHRLIDVDFFIYSWKTHIVIREKPEIALKKFKKFLLEDFYVVLLWYYNLFIMIIDFIQVYYRPTYVRINGINGTQFLQMRVREMEIELLEYFNGWYKYLFELIINYLYPYVFWNLKLRSFFLICFLISFDCIFSLKYIYNKFIKSYILDEMNIFYNINVNESYEYFLVPSFIKKNQNLFSDMFKQYFFIKYLSDTTRFMKFNEFSSNLNLINNLSLISSNNNIHESININLNILVLNLFIFYKYNLNFKNNFDLLLKKIYFEFLFFFTYIDFVDYEIFMEDIKHSKILKNLSHNFYSLFPLISSVNCILKFYDITLKKIKLAAVNKFLFITLICGAAFLFCQLAEYYENLFEFCDSVYGSTFYIMTGFHGLHVIAGMIFIIVVKIRLNLKHFTKKHHIGLLLAIWYWHFVDIVWVLLFLIVYIWGS